MHTKSTMERHRCSRLAVAPFLRIIVIAAAIKGSFQMSMNVDSAVRFRKWLIDGGAYLNPKVEIDFFPGLGYGLKSTESISPSEMICAIPEHLCLHSHGKYALENVTTQLAVELKKGVESIYYPFLCTLPEDSSFIPATWSQERVLNMDLQGTQMEKDMKDMYSRWQTDAQKEVLKLSLCENKYQAVSESDWLWARATMQARGFSFRKKSDTKKSPLSSIDSKSQIEPSAEQKDIRSKDESDDLLNIVSFIPFTTLSNHDDDLGGITTMGDGDLYPYSSFTFKTAKKVEPKSQIFNFYGDLSFQQKFLSFGWVDRSPAFSPEGFSITVLDVLIGNGETMQVEMKSNILLGTASSVSTVVGAIKNNADKKLSTDFYPYNFLLNKGQDMSAKDMGLKITILKFEIRKIIQNIEERGVERGVVLSLLEMLLLEKRKSLIESSQIRLLDANKSDIVSSVLPLTDSKQGTDRTKSNTKAKKVKKVSPVNVQTIETDGQYIRRMELEALDLLLIHLPTC